MHYRPRRRWQDHLPAQARRQGGGTPRLHAAEVRALRKPERRREPEALRRSPRREARRFCRARGAAPRRDQPSALQVAHGGKALGRHETETRPRVCARERTRHAHPRRADRRRGRGLSPRTVGDPQVVHRGARNGSFRLDDLRGRRRLLRQGDPAGRGIGTRADSAAHGRPPRRR